MYSKDQSCLQCRNNKTGPALAPGNFMFLTKQTPVLSKQGRREQVPKDAITYLWALKSRGQKLSNGI